MTGTDETLRPEKSRITIFDEPVICSFCNHDVCHEQTKEGRSDSGAEKRKSVK